MRKVLLFVIGIILFFPSDILALDNNCEKIQNENAKTLDIQIKQEIINEDEIDKNELSKFKFKYKILDLDNNVLDETTNDEEGKIVFHCFTAKTENREESYEIYKIIMEEDKSIPFEYDPSIIYFSVKSRWTNNLYDPVIAYYKDDGNPSPEKYNETYKRKIFHATEEELQGQAYAVLDSSLGVLTFFRDEVGKYNDKQIVGDKTYYTGFEEGEDYSGFGRWSYSDSVKKIVFQDAIKPKSIKNWFSYLYALEEADISKLDTSLISNLDSFFQNCPKLKSLDISTLDTTNVTSIWKMLYMVDLQYIDLTVWNLNQDLTRMQMSESLSRNPNLRYLNISNLGDWTSSAELGGLPCLEYLVINDKYTFGNTNGPGYDNSFSMIENGYYYSPVKNKKYTAQEIRNNLYNHSEEMAGYYIRPMCMTNASFVSQYRKIDEENKNEDGIIKNPETGEKFYVFAIIIGIGLVVCFSKKKLDNMRRI